MPRKNQPDLLRDLDKFDRLAKESLRTINKEIRYFKGVHESNEDETISPGLRSLLKNLRQSEIFLTQALSKSLNIQKKI